MSREEDERFMRRAIALAMRGRGAVEPNPMVGCVIVKDGREIGSGFHRKYGWPHAEPNALASCTETPRGATAYVTLEPCCHLNKQTPPCTPRLIEAGIARVVAGSQDPSPEVSGRGFEQLRKAGIEVDDGMLLDECRQLIAPFYARIVLRRPYVTLKWAQTADGKVAGADGMRLRITGEGANDVVHDLRSRCDAILVGVNTVIADDPMLTVRGRTPMRTLTRIVLDRHVRIPFDSQLVRTAREQPLLVFCGPDPDADRVRKLALRGIGVDGVQVFDLRDVLKSLHLRGCTHLLVEGGPTVAQAFMRENLVDRAWIFRSSKTYAGPGAPAAPTLPVAYVKTGERILRDDLLAEFLNKSSDAFFANEPSADFEHVASKLAAKRGLE